MICVLNDEADSFFCVAALVLCDSRATSGLWHRPDVNEGVPRLDTKVNNRERLADHSAPYTLPPLYLPFLSLSVLHVLGYL